MASRQRLTAELITCCKKCTHGNKVTVEFPDVAFTFHAQWLYDARCDDGASRNAASAFCQQVSVAQVQSIGLSGKGLDMTLDVTWKDGSTSRFPAPWLRVMGALVAAKSQVLAAESIPSHSKGWLVENLKIPEISYQELFSENLAPEQSEAITGRILDSLLDVSAPGIVKVVGLPAPIIEDEEAHRNNLVTRVLKKLFGSVFIHPVRGADTTFNVSSHDSNAKRAIGLPNYDTTQVLLPHVDHAFYNHPVHVMGFYGLKGESENTWVSSFRALTTFQDEAPDLVKHLHNAPMALGRLSRFYGNPLYQGTVDTAVTAYPGFPDQIKRVRWHPNLTGSIIAPFDDFKKARLAHSKFQEIIRRDTHQLKLPLKLGDLYIWDNFRLLHGREKIMSEPRTGVGQTVPEQVVADRYRALQINRLKRHIDDEWLVHMPLLQLREMVKFVEATLDVSGPVLGVR